MSLDHNLLQDVLQITGAKSSQQKEAYAPPAPAPPPMDPAMMGGGAPSMGAPAMAHGMGGMPPMDPSMMGGGAPMDPMMGAGAPPMDPSMVGSLPPEGGAPGGEGAIPVQLTMQDLQAILAQAQGGEPAAAEPAAPEAVDSGRVTNKDIDARISGLEDMLSSMMSAMGISMPEMPSYAATDDAAAGGDQAALDAGLFGGAQAPAVPEPAAMSAGATGLDQLPPMPEGLNPAAAGELPKTAAERRELLHPGGNMLLEYLQKIRTAR